MINYSIVIPCFKCSKTLEATLKSVLAQTYKNYEIILIDDNEDYSESEKILKLIKDIKKSCNSINIKYLKNIHNSGPSYSRNRGWDNANGDYIAFLDSDDTWHPQKLEIVTKILINKPDIDLLGHSETIKHSVLKNINQIKHYQAKSYKAFYLLLKNPITTPSVTIRRSIDLRFNTELRYAEDQDMWLRIAQKNYKIIKITNCPLTILGHKPLTGDGLSSHRIQMKLGELKAINQNFIKYYPKYLLLLPLLWLYIFIKFIRRELLISLNL